MDRFEEEVLVRWAHTDPAGIVFYPRYFEMINALVEDWFAGPLGCDFETLHGEFGTGVPTVSIECEFVRPARLVLACIDLETGRVRPIPEQIRSRMVGFELRRAG
jgi:acyl-CoA thioesterase FadM